MTLATLVAIRDLRDTALMLLSVYGQTSRRRTAVTEENGDLRNGPWPWMDGVINWPPSLKHREAARDGFGGLRGGKTQRAAAWDSFVVNRQHCEDPTSKALPETYYSGRG